MKVSDAAHRRSAEVTAVTGAAGERSYIPLFWRLFVPNATVLAAACIVLMVEPANGRVIALVGGLLTMLLVNLVMMRRAFAPLVRLTTVMRRIDPLRPGQRVSVPGPASEVTVLAEAFNAMLDRLERERRESGRRALAAQEAERRHLAAELHDEIGQTLTALVLQLDRIAERAGEGARRDALDARDTAVGLVAGVRALARRLRPEALDELGLPAALTNLVERFSSRTGLPVERRIERRLPPLSEEAELVIYRIAQESLTNVVRHAEADQAVLTLRADDGDVLLEVADDGRGFAQDVADQGGIRHMRERAVLIGADLTIGPRAGRRGTAVALRVGREEQRTRAHAAEGAGSPR